MRIIAGQNRGLILADVGAGDVAAHLRPTPDRVRESLFNILRSHDQPGPQTRVLDLFAGTGALGLEALSRGALHATFVDSGRAALTLLRANIAKCRRGDVATVLACDVAKLPVAPAPASLVFLDPPYGLGLGGPALTTVRATGWITPGTLIVWEEAAAQTPPPGFTLLDHRRYGGTWITLLEAA